MKQFVCVAALVVSALCIGQKVNAAPVFVGSWKVDDGPSWPTNPPVYSGQEAAALLFGGAPGDYMISTDPVIINFSAHYDGWAESDTVFAQDFHFDLGAPGYNDPGGVGSAWSAYVMDHSDEAVNYAWKDDGVVDLPIDRNPCEVPEPCSMALLGMGLIPLFKKFRLG